MSTASFTRVSWGRSSSFQKESGKKDADGDTINSDGDVMVMTMSSSSAAPSKDEELLDAREDEAVGARDDDIADDLEKDTVSASEDSDSDSASSSEESFSMELTLTDSISMASTKSTKSAKDSVEKSRSTEASLQGRSNSNLEAKEMAAEKTATKRDLPPLAPKAKSSASLPPLPPAISPRRVSSTSSGMGRKLKKSMPGWISRSFSNPKKTESADSEELISFSFEQPRATSKDSEGRNAAELSSPRSENDSVVLIETVDTVETASTGAKDSIADVKSESSEASEDKGETIGTTEDDDAEAEAVASIQLEETTAATSFQLEETTAATSFHVEDETAATSFHVEDETAATSFQLDETTAATSFHVEETTAATSFQLEETTAATSFQLEDETVDTSVQAEEETVDTSAKDEEETAADSVQAEEEIVATSVKSEEANGPATSKRTGNDKKTVEGETIAGIIANAEAQALLDTIIDKVKEGTIASNDDLSTGKELDNMVFAVDSGYEESKARKEDTKEEEVDPVLSAGSDCVSAVDSGLNDIQDPWPNPWLDAEMNGELPEASNPIKPDESTPASAPEPVIDRVVGVASGLEDHSVASAASQPKVRASITESSSLLSHMKAYVEKNGSSVKSIPSEKEQDDAESFVTQHTDHQSTFQAEVFVATAPVRECITLEDNVEAAILDYWDGFVPESRTDASSLKGEQNNADSKTNATTKSKAGAPAGSKVKPAKTRPFWKRAKIGTLKKKENDGESKPTIGKKFKLAYLCMLQPCKKSDATKAVGKARVGGDRAAEQNTEKAESADNAISPSVAKSTSASPDDIMDMEEMGTRTIEELDHILNPNESHDDLTAADPMPDSTVQAVRSDMEETKEDLRQAEPRSWLSDSPSDDSATRRNTNLSVMSSYDLSRAESDVPQDTMMGTLGYYADVAAKAVQYNLYDVPVREFEKIRELTCHHDSGLDVGRQLNLLDRDIGASDSQQDGINVGTNDKVDPSKTSANPFAVVFKELMDVLECSPVRTSTQPYSKKRAIEEAKVEMI